MIKQQGKGIPLEKIAAIKSLLQERQRKKSAAVSREDLMLASHGGEVCEETGRESGEGVGHDALEDECLDRIHDILFGNSKSLKSSKVAASKD
eukprot:CAMPEP_0168338368 /NCGR_PEP_ID=MMETSP0213-20121227/12788_1 /TAXON_ID=151035 /ORGANISM="Euplotes harpa, Strain FSP1.4" /LENGTH=92 /DNA_ID=CAMNT_0008344123 /DNA_START=17 /DNA_END=295 /DNA_ORIENTATION=-